MKSVSPLLFVLLVFSSVWYFTSDFYTPQQNLVPPFADTQTILSTTTPSLPPITSATSSLPMRVVSSSNTDTNTHISNQPLPQRQKIQAPPTVTTTLDQAPSLSQSKTTLTQSSTTRDNIPRADFVALNTSVRATVVNILCTTTARSGMNGVSGSGVIIDPRGIILTNAHVAQYVMLAQSSRLQISCTVRTGSPAQPRYTVDVLAFPTSWTQLHAKDFAQDSARSTGEDDWALLYITGRTNGAVVSRNFSFLPLETGDQAVHSGSQVLLVGYPAGFLKGYTIIRNLWQSSAVVLVKHLYTFTKTNIDLISLGGSIVAQGGSSGGAVVNQLNKLVGIIVTSTVADTTQKRNLRALTLSHITRSFKQNTGQTLSQFLAHSNPDTQVAIFKNTIAPTLLKYYSL